MSDPVVTVLLTSYNQAGWLRQAVDSVRAQTLAEWELLIVENGSDDGSLELLKDYQGDRRIEIISYETNQPHTVVSNAALRLARGRFVSFLYSDDYYLPEKLERQVRAFDSLGPEVGVVYSGGFRLQQDGSLTPLPCGAFQGDVLEALLTRTQFFPPISPLVRRECLERYPFNEAIFVEGEGIFSKIALSYRFQPLPGELVVMRDTPFNMAKELGPNLKRDVLMIESLFSRPEFPKRLRHLREPVLAGLYRARGWQAIRRGGDRSRARGWLLEAARLSPRTAASPRWLLGLVLCALPAPLLGLAQRVLNAWKGTPPAITPPATPVEGRR